MPNNYGFNQVKLILGCKQRGNAQHSFQQLMLGVSAVVFNENKAFNFSKTAWQMFKKD